MSLNTEFYSRGSEMWSDSEHEVSESSVGFFLSKPSYCSNTILALVFLWLTREQLSNLLCTFVIWTDIGRMFYSTPKFSAI